MKELERDIWDDIILRNLLNVQVQEYQFGCFYTRSIHKNRFKEQKYGTESVDEIFYCGMTRAG